MFDLRFSASLLLCSPKESPVCASSVVRHSDPFQWVTCRIEKQALPSVRSETGAEAQGYDLCSRTVGR